MLVARRFIQLLVVAAIAIATFLHPQTLDAKEFVVVIDAGHGGKDAGALGKNTTEKEINLAVAKLLGAEINRRYGDIRVVYTRSTDVFVTIKGRMDKAKAEKADLFISLHCNSAAYENPRRTQLAGTSVYVLGNNNANDNIDMAMRENEAILLEDNYKTTYKGFDNSPEYYIFTEINQSKMMGKSNTVANKIQRQLVNHVGLKDNHVNETSRLWLLLHSTMPAVLIEMDFICNPNREKFLSSPEGQKKIAEAICNGIHDYRLSLGHKATLLAKQDAPEKTEKTNDAKREKAEKPGSADNATAPATKSAPTSGKDKPIEKPSKKKTNEETPKESPKANNQNHNVGKTVFAIQFYISDCILKEGSPRLKNIKQANYYVDGKAYKYYTGQFDTMEAATAQLKEVKKQFPDAFVIKICNGQRIK